MAYLHTRRCPAPLAPPSLGDCGCGCAGLGTCSPLGADDGGLKLVAVLGFGALLFGALHFWAKGSKKGK